MKVWAIEIALEAWKWLTDYDLLILAGIWRTGGSGKPTVEAWCRTQQDGRKC